GHTGRDCTVVQFIRHAVRSGVSLPTDVEIPVSLGKGSPVLPTSIGMRGLINALPQLIDLFWGILMVHVKAPTSCATLRAVTAAPGLSVSPKFTIQREA